MAPVTPVLAQFREAYTSLLIAAERLRAELDGSVADTTPRDIRTIQIVVADYFSVPMGRLLSRQRDGDTVRARHVAMAFCRELTTHSLVVIGESFLRDHGAVVNGVRAYKDRCTQDKAFRLSCEALRMRAQDAVQPRIS